LDLLGKTRWFLNELIISFNEYMNPSPYLCVDELMIAYNGRYCGFKQYLPAKPITHGIKVFVMYCTTTRYILNWEVYVGTGMDLGMVHHGKGAEVQDDGRAGGFGSDMDEQVLPEPTQLQVDRLDTADEDFVDEAPGAESSTAAEDRAARRVARLLSKKIGLGTGAVVVNRLSAGLDHMYYTMACDNYFTSPALF
jgi:hypothetical protein